MDKIRVIHILPIIPHPVAFKISAEEYFKGQKESGDFTAIEKYPYWIGFFNYDHHVNTAKQLLNYSDKFEVECWRPYSRIEKIYSKEVDGIVHRAFPSKKVNIKHFYDFHWSSEMIKYLKEYSKTNRVIVNLTTGHSFYTMHFLQQFRKRSFPIVCIHRSGGFRIFDWNRLKPLKKLLRLYYLLESIYDIKTLSFSDYYIVMAKPEADFIKNKKLPIKASGYFMEGIDFDRIKPGNHKEKMKLRKILKIPVDKKVFIVCGDFASDNYNYKILYDIYNEIKAEHPDLYVINIGGYKHQDLYQYGLRCGVCMIEKVPHDVFIDYLRSSDFFGQPMINPAVIYGGLGVAMVEALACNLPVISDHLLHFPGTTDELNNIGLRANDKESLRGAIIYMKEHFTCFNNCREIARKYFDVNETSRVVFDKYLELSRQYFDE